MTIFAPLTGRGGAVTLVRLSGPRALAITAALAGALPKPRQAALRRLTHAGRALDEALITLFPAPHSFTGEDCAEFSLHGGRAVWAAVAAALTALGARPAEPGEFSRRALYNGKLDLLGAEAMADLIAAETEAQRALALETMHGLGAAIAGWRERLRQLIARQEALIDFPDEDLPPEVEAALLTGIAQLRDDMRAALSAAPAAERLREGLEFVILGAPNAGKSPLLNALAGDDIAIVSDLPGTTRDALGVRVDLGGVPVHLTDTAGLRDTTDQIEAEGVRRAHARAARADFLLLTAAPGETFPEAPPGTPHLRLRTKADLARSPDGDLSLSAKTGQGLAELRAALISAAHALTDTKGAAALARPRQVACARDAAQALTAALPLDDPELRGEELRMAAHALARLAGAIGVEDVLDAVFSSFCIGK
ncbi:tRNA uridine-5-carboxymethylaminomethyl(34) synthesis GTPase MnmE [Acidocella sp.]|uniref:tRNA uridine-5-carboxymethylaminomethyl(34) synthesis GTPase MnmE n=1 Tax=Acidocella sp. TaxID=50710 RepID=UPI00262266B1|nr:tRNA uridine-5-carboxymethylaminomethyl(34) synthesis GTPase MnmE [Acidocella sp.]